jgi:uncharacterized damage-inducible protein DinB
MTDRTPASLFVAFSRVKLLDEYWPRLQGCVELLSDEQLWWRPNEASNSVGNLLLHLNGNVRQWLVVPFTDAADDRQRPDEFAARADVPAAALLDRLNGTLREVAAVLSRLTEAELVNTYQIQGYTVSGLDAVYHVVEHFGMHYGQIVYVTKLVRGADLGFYRELDKTGRKE